jgi:hypothetical protein
MKGVEITVDSVSGETYVAIITAYGRRGWHVAYSCRRPSLSGRPAGEACYECGQFTRSYDRAVKKAKRRLNRWAATDQRTQDAALGKLA